MKRKTGNRFLIGILIFSLLFSSIGLMGLTVPVTETAKEAPTDNPDAWDGVTANVNWYFGLDKETREKEKAVFTLNTPEDLAGVAVMLNYRDQTFWYDSKTGNVVTTEDGTVIYKHGGVIYPKGEEEPSGGNIVAYKKPEKCVSFRYQTLELGADMDLGSHPFAPLGCGSSFQGTLDGKDKIISNLTIVSEKARHTTNTLQYYVGLIGCCANEGNVKNLTIENEEIYVEVPNYTGKTTGTFNIGGVVSDARNTAAVSKVTVNGLKIRAYSANPNAIAEEDNHLTNLKVGAISGAWSSSGSAADVTVTDYDFYSSYSPYTVGDEMIASMTKGTTSNLTLKKKNPTVWSGAVADVSWYAADPSAGTFTVSTLEDLYGLAALTDYATNEIYVKDNKVLFTENGDIIRKSGESTLPTGATVPDGATTVSGSKFVGKTVKIGDDIDCGGKAFPTIGRNSSWQGTLDGDSHTLKNILLNNLSSGGRPDGKYYQGIVGFVAGDNDEDVATGGTVKNLTLENVTIDMIVQQGVTMYVGALAGDVENTASGFENVRVNGLSVKFSPESEGVTAANIYYGAAMGLTRASADIIHTGIVIYDYEINNIYGNTSFNTVDMFKGYGKHTFTDSHIFGDEWVNTDPENHWHICLVEGCEEPSEKIPHDFETKYDPAPTQEQGGKMYKECTVCGYATAKEDVGPLDHEHVVTAHPEVPATCTTPGTHAYWTCSHPTCEGKKYKSEDCTDVWDEDELTIAVDASAHTGNTDETLHSDENGHFKVCSECKKEFDRAAHNPGTEWKTGDGKHWHECADCGFHTSEAAHTMEWVVDKAATTEAEGSRHEACTACGATGKTESIPKLAKTVWDGKTVDVSWYFSNPNADTFTISTPEQLAGMAVLMNYRDQTFYYDANGKVVTTESGEVIYKIKDVIYPAGATEPTGDGITATGGNSLKGKTIKLAGDIDLGGKPFAPIGCGSSFQGTFDGDGHTISNLYITTEKGRHTTLTEQHYVGLFGVLAADAQVKNFTLQNVELNVSVPATATMVHVGAIASDIRQQSSVTDVAVKGLKVRVTENGGNCALVLGALIGDDATTGTVDKLSAQNYDYEAKYSGKILTEEDETIGRIQSAASKPGTLTVQKGSATTGDALLTVGTVSLAVLCLGGAVLLGKKKKEH